MTDLPPHDIIIEKEKWLTVTSTIVLETTMQLLSKRSLYLDLKTYTCKDCNQVKPKAQFFNPLNLDSAHQKKSDRCNDCRESYFKRYYETKVRAKNIADRSLKALRTIISKMQTPGTPDRIVAKIVIHELCKCVKNLDPSMIVLLTKKETDIMKQQQQQQRLDVLSKQQQQQQRLDVLSKQLSEDDNVQRLTPTITVNDNANDNN